jgi:hypothetical protein
MYFRCRFYPESLDRRTDSEHTETDVFYTEPEGSSLMKTELYVILAAFFDSEHYFLFPDGL